MLMLPTHRLEKKRENETAAALAVLHGHIFHHRLYLLVLPTHRLERECENALAVLHDL